MIDQCQDENTSTYVAFICQSFSAFAFAFAVEDKLWMVCIEYRVGVRRPEEPLRLRVGGPESFSKSALAARGMTPAIERLAFTQISPGTSRLVLEQYRTHELRICLLGRTGGPHCI